MGPIPLAWRIATSPVWLLWSGYAAMWWLFEDDPAPAAKSPAPAPKPGPTPGPTPGPANAQAVPAAVAAPIAPPAPAKPKRPTQALIGGFIGTGFFSAAALIGTNAAAQSGFIAHDRALGLWLWITATVALTSQYMIKRAVARDRIARDKKPWRSPAQFARDSFRSLKASAAGAAARGATHAKIASIEGARYAGRVSYSAACAAARQARARASKLAASDTGGRLRGMARSIAGLPTEPSPAPHAGPVAQTTAA